MLRWSCQENCGTRREEARMPRACTKRKPCLLDYARGEEDRVLCRQEGVANLPSSAVCSKRSSGMQASGRGSPVLPLVRFSVQKGCLITRSRPSPKERATSAQKTKSSSRKVLFLPIQKNRCARVLYLFGIYKGARRLHTRRPYQRRGSGLSSH